MTTMFDYNFLSVFFIFLAAQFFYGNVSFGHSPELEHDDIPTMWWGVDVVLLSFNLTFGVL